MGHATNALLFDFVAVRQESWLAPSSLFLACPVAADDVTRKFGNTQFLCVKTCDHNTPRPRPLYYRQSGSTSGLLMVLALRKSLVSLMRAAKRAEIPSDCARLRYKEGRG